MRYFTIVLGVAGALVSANTAQAQLQGDEYNQGYVPVDVDLTLGVGLGWSPEYRGGDDYEAIIVPVMGVEYKNAVFANLTNDDAYDAVFTDKPHGIGFNLIQAQENGGWSAGLSLLPDFGRDQSDASRLNGLGDIDETALFGGYAKYSHGPYFAIAQLHQDILDEHDGFIGEIAVGGSHLFNRQLRGTMKVFAEYNSDNYTEDFFGVSAAQAVASGLPTFAAEGGFNEFGVAGNLTYAVTPGIFVQGLFELSTLSGDAEDSPVTDEEVQLLLGTTVGYKF